MIELRKVAALKKEKRPKQKRQHLQFLSDFLRPRTNREAGIVAEHENENRL